jgi:hypothetical protein
MVKQAFRIRVSSLAEEVEQDLRKEVEEEMEKEEEEAEVEEEEEEDFTFGSLGDGETSIQDKSQFLAVGFKE